MVLDMKELISEFKKETGWNGSLWHMGVVEEFGNWLINKESRRKTEGTQFKKAQ